MKTYESHRDSPPFLWLTPRRDISIIEDHQISTRTMYHDYDLDYTFSSNEFYAYDLDEMLEYHMQSLDVEQDTYDLDDDYARDSCDYDALAYRHYA